MAIILSTFPYYRMRQFPVNIKPENVAACPHTTIFPSLTSDSCCDSQHGIHTILPEWMLEKTELICPPNSIHRNELIGSGQYGTVHKGSYTHGTAR